jgi:hypothetical protein
MQVRGPQPNGKNAGASLLDALNNPLREPLCPELARVGTPHTFLSWWTHRSGSVVSTTPGGYLTPPRFVGASVVRWSAVRGVYSRSI